MREHNASHLIGRRLTAPPACPVASQSVEPSTDLTAPAQTEDESKRQEDIEWLTQRLDSARRDQLEIDKQFQDEDQESQKVLKELAQERDRLKHTLREREETSIELRKHGNYLDKLNRAAQSKKATQEKLLAQRRAERKKMSEEIHRWDQQTFDINNDTDHMLDEKAGIIAGSDIALSDARKRITSDQILMKKIEEEIHLTGGQIKAIENDVEAAEQTDSDKGLSARAEMESEQAWEANALAAQAQVANLWQVLQQVFIRQIDTLRSLLI